MKHRHIAILGLLAGCASVEVPDAAQLARADFGPYPTAYEATVKAHYVATLKDPDAVLYRSISAPKKQWLGDRLNPAGTYAYLVCATFNAKNAFGGYVGYKTDAFLLRGGSIVRVLEGAEFGAGTIC